MARLRALKPAITAAPTGDANPASPSIRLISQLRGTNMKLPSINLANWKTWLVYGNCVLGGFLAGGLSATYPPSFIPTLAKHAPAVAVKEVKTQPVSFDRATVACTASLAATENLRKDIVELCKAAKPQVKASVTK
jgi:hypothetical protein